MWIKLWADHGGGRQSHTEEYLWFDEEPADDYLEETWSEWTRDNFMHDYIIGGSEVVDSPPLEEVEFMLADYQAQEEHAQKMIKILELCKHNLAEQSGQQDAEKTDVPVVQKVTSGWGFPLLGKKWHYFDNDAVSLCGKWMYTGELEEGQDQYVNNCRACSKKREALLKKSSLNKT